MLVQEQVSRFVVPPCPRCGGILKPNIVFFGDNVPAATAAAVRAATAACGSLLVVGSSLQVYSGYRIVLQAKEELGLPVAIVNIGATRADRLADVIVNGAAGDVLPRIKLKS